MVVNNLENITDNIKDFGEITGIISEYICNRHYQKKWYYWYKHSLKKDKIINVA